MIFYDESSPIDEKNYERLVDAVHRAEAEIFVKMCEDMMYEIYFKKQRGKSED